MCKNIKNTIKPDPKLKTSVAKKAENKLKTKIDIPINIKDLLPNISSKKELTKVNNT